MRLRRKLNWESELDSAIREAANREFKWSEFDCCSWACDTVQRMTGVDVMKAFRGAYHDRNSAVRMIRDRVHEGGLEELCDRVALMFNLTPVPPLYAQRGDFVLVEENARHSLAIVSLDGRYALASAAKGLGLMPQEAWVKAWRV